MPCLNRHPNGLISLINEIHLYPAFPGVPFAYPTGINMASRLTHFHLLYHIAAYQIQCNHCTTYCATEINMNSNEAQSTRILSFINVAPFSVEIHQPPVDCPQKGSAMRKSLSHDDATVSTFTSFRQATFIGSKHPSSPCIKAVITATMIVIFVPSGGIIGVPCTCRQFRVPLCAIDRFYNHYISPAPCEPVQINCQGRQIVHN